MTHRDLQAVLDRLDAGCGAAEAHGLLCGALCSRASYDLPQWLQELTQDADADVADGTAATRLQPVFDRTLASLRSPDFRFSPLLPADDAALAARVSALAEWCGGFLFGIGTAAAGAAVMQDGNVGEFLGDLTDISRAELEPGRNAEAGESDFVELFEFVRAGTQLTWEALATLRTARPPTAAARP
jgi:uncharacterized protein YgfB (UPF0149 family)